MTLGSEQVERLEMGSRGRALSQNAKRALVSAGPKRKRSDPTLAFGPSKAG
jgi:hypothetical protein